MLSKYFPLPVSCSLYLEFVDRNAIQVGFSLQFTVLNTLSVRLPKRSLAPAQIYVPSCAKDCMGTTAPPNLRLIVQLVL